MHLLSTTTYAHPSSCLSVADRCFIDQDDVPFANAVANAVLHPDGKVASLDSLFVTPGTAQVNHPLYVELDAYQTTFLHRLNHILNTLEISLEDAISTAEETLGSTFISYTPALTFSFITIGTGTAVTALSSFLILTRGAALATASLTILNGSAPFVNACICNNLRPTASLAHARFRFSFLCLRR